jgi:hypothetical protein
LVSPPTFPLSNLPTFLLRVSHLPQVRSVRVHNQRELAMESGRF